MFITVHLVLSQSVICDVYIWMFINYFDNISHITSVIDSTIFNRAHHQSYINTSDKE